ncbi:MAG: hypothetical protein DRQ44_01175 [Gammaproteobacteria bacterium]|nr:MAG: hypothetical protein DRQ44_01175 [Gammaproteobacteria bacterium]
MLMQRRKTDIKSDSNHFESDDFVESNLHNVFSQNFISGSLRDSLGDYFRFAFYCILLAVPLYAITISIIRSNWIMVIIDALIVPVGFVHGLLLLFGYVV